MWRPVAGRTPTSYADNKDDLLRRLRRMEGQVRGLQQMVDDERYCLDVVQQINALSAAAPEVALSIIEGHLRGCVEAAVTNDGGDAATKELIRVLRQALRQ